jgi:hypothetical protein
MGRLATVGWDVGVRPDSGVDFLIIAWIVGHCVGFKWRWRRRTGSTGRRSMKPVELGPAVGLHLTFED